MDLTQLWKAEAPKEQLARGISQVQIQGKAMRRKFFALYRTLLFLCPEFGKETLAHEEWIGNPHHYQ